MRMRLYFARFVWEFVGRTLEGKLAVGFMKTKTRVWVDDRRVLEVVV